MLNPFEEIIAELNEIKQTVAVIRSTPAAPPAEIIGRDELLKRLSITEPTAIRWAKKGVIPEIRIGSSVRYNWSSVVKMLEAQKK